MLSLTNKCTIYEVCVKDFGIIESARVRLQDGLYYIRGVNKDVPNACANMVGKSTLLSAICWVLYGTDTQGNRMAERAIRTGAETASVCLTIDDPRGVAAIVRERYKKAVGGSVERLLLNLRGRPNTNWGVTTMEMQDAQAWIVAELGDAQTFIASHFLAYEDGHIPYALLPDREQKDMFSKILCFEELDKAYDKAIEKEKALAVKVTRIEHKMRELEGRIQGQMRGSYDLADRLTSIEEEAKKQYTEICEKQKEAERLCNKAYRDAEESKKVYETQNDKLINLLSSLRPMEELLKIQKEKVYEMKHAEECPTCGTKLKEGQWKEILGKTWTEYRKNKKIVEAIVAANGDPEDLKDLVVKKQQEYREKEKYYRECEQAFQEVERQQKTLKHGLAELEKNKKVLCESDNNNLMVLFSVRDALKDALNDYKKELEAIAFWKVGFGKNGIRVHRLEKITPRLNEIAAELSNGLFGDGTTVVYETVKQIKTGEYRDKFNISIVGPDAKPMVKVSAGQAARRDLIHLLSMAILTRELSHSKLNFIAIDEGFRTMDAAGVKAAVNILELLAPTLGTILVVEHDDELASMFDHVIDVVREDGSSTIRY